MNIKELITELQKFPEPTRVLIQGYEDGYDTVTDVKQIIVKLGEDKAWYNGKYEEVNEGEKAVVILSKDRMLEA